jgi:hypothetical protein
MYVDGGNAFWRAVRVIANEKNATANAASSGVTITVDHGSGDREVYQFTPSYTRDSWDKFVQLTQKFLQKVVQMGRLDERARAREIVLIALDVRGFSPRNAMKVADRMKNPKEDGFWEEHRPNPEFNM